MVLLNLSLLYQYNSIYFPSYFHALLSLTIKVLDPSEPLLGISFPSSLIEVHSFRLWFVSVAFTFSLSLFITDFFNMRSSAILVAALVGVASAGMPNWPLTWSATASGVYEGVGGPTGRPHLGPGPVSEIPHTGGSFPTAYSKDHHREKEHHNSSGIFPSKKHHSEKYHHKPTGSGIGPTGTGIGPTGTGHGGSPTTPGPHTTTITKTSDVTSK